MLGQDGFGDFLDVGLRVDRKRAAIAAGGPLQRFEPELARQLSWRVDDLDFNRKPGNEDLVAVLVRDDGGKPGQREGLLLARIPPLRRLGLGLGFFFLPLGVRLHVDFERFRILGRPRTWPVAAKDVQGRRAQDQLPTALLLLILGSLGQVERGGLLAIAGEMESQPLDREAGLQVNLQITDIA